MNDWKYNRQMRSSSSPLVRRDDQLGSSTFYDLNKNELDGIVSSLKDARLSSKSSGLYAQEVVRKDSPFADSIQRAINKVSSLGGGVVFLDAGTYVQSGSIAVHSNISVVGVDPALTTIDFNNTNHSISIVGTIGARKNNVSFKNLSIKNSDRPSTASGDVLEFNYVDGIIVDNCIFEKNGTVSGYLAADVGISNSTRVIVTNCFSGTSQNFVNVQDSSSVWINNNYIKDPIGRGIFSDSGTAIDISGNTFDTWNKEAINIQGNSINVTNNHLFGGTQIGINLNTGTPSYNYLSGNIIQMDQGTAIYINGTAVGNNISNNVLIGSIELGIKLVRGADNTISGNTMMGGTTGISIDSNSQRTIIAANNMVAPTTGISDSGNNGTTFGNLI